MKNNSMLAYLLMYVVLLSCEQGLQQGVVIDKHHEKGRFDTRVEYNVIFNKVMPNVTWKDESFTLIVQGLKGKETITQRFNVSKSEYKNTIVSDTVTFE